MNKKSTLRVNLLSASFYVGPPGLEPGTPWLWVRCSNQLSYRPSELLSLMMGGKNRKNWRKFIKYAVLHVNFWTITIIIISHAANWYKLLFIKWWKIPFHPSPYSSVLGALIATANLKCHIWKKEILLFSEIPFSLPHYPFWFYHFFWGVILQHRLIIEIASLQIPRSLGR